MKMKIENRILVYSAVAATLCTLTTQAGAAASSSRPPSGSANHSAFGIQRGTQVIKDDVYDPGNKKIGKVDDIVVDLTSGHVLYTVVDGSNGKVAVPPQAFASSRANRLTLSADAAQKLKDAPKFTSEIDQQQAISKADFVDKVYQHFGESAWWQGSSAPADAGSFNNVHKVSKLAGMKVQNASNQPLGQVNNVALDMSHGRVMYVILTPDKDLKLGNSLYALPPDAFTPGADQNSLTSGIDREKLAAAPHFNNDQWSRLSDPAWASQVYQYYGKQAWFNNTAPGTLQPTGR